MIYEVALIKEELFYELMDIIDKHIDDLEDGHKRVVSGLKYMEKEIGLDVYDDRDVYMSDVNSVVNNAVDVLTTLEASGVLSKEDADTFSDYCTKILEAQEIECSRHICVGSLVIAEDGHPYQICEIDYDDFSVKLWDGDEMNSGYWESPLKCRAKA